MNEKTQKTTLIVLLVLGCATLCLLVFLLLFHSRSVNDSKKNLLESTTDKPLPDIFHSGKLYGVNVDMSQLLPNSMHYVKNSRGEDLIDIAHTLGINVFRITSVTPSAKQYTPYTKNEWDSVLDKMQRNNIRALVLIESPVEQKDFSSGTIDTTKYLSLLHSFITAGVLNHPDVVAVDLKNEPVLTNDHLVLLKQARDIVKEENSNLSVTVGGWRVAQTETQFHWNIPTDVVPLSSIVDFYSLHAYRYDIPTKEKVYPDPIQLTNQYIALLAKAIPTPKAIFISEFGAGNGDAFTDQGSLGSQALQKQIYQGVFTALNQPEPLQVLGATAFLFASRNTKPDGWAILANNGNTIYPAAYTIQSAMQNVTPQTMPANSISQAPTTTILTSNDSGKIVTGHIGDVIGIELKGIPGGATSEYSNPHILTVTQPLYYDGWGSKQYYAVFHLQQFGSTNVRIGNFSVTILCK